MTKYYLADNVEFKPGMTVYSMWGGKIYENKTEINGTIDGTEKDWIYTGYFATRAFCGDTWFSKPENVINHYKNKYDEELQNLRKQLQIKEESRNYEFDRLDHELNQYLKRNS